MTRSMKMTALSLATMLCATPFVTPSARAGQTEGLLNLVPQEAWGFVVLRSLETVDQRAALLKETLGLPIPPAVTPMMLGMLPVGDALDTGGPVCIVMMDAQKYGAGDFKNALVILLPSKTPKTLLEKLKGPGPAGGAATSQPAEPASADGLSRCTIMGQPFYAAPMKKYLVLGGSKDCVAKVSKPAKSRSADMDETRRSILDQSDVFISVSVRSIFGAYKDMVMPMMRMVMSATDPEGKTADQLEKTFAEIKAWDLALTLDKGGLNFQMVTVPKKGSDLAKMMRDTKNADEPLLSVLPKEKYLLAVGSTGGYSEHAEKFGSANLMSTMFKQMQLEGMDEESVKTLDKELVKLTKGMGPLAFCLSALPESKNGMFGFTFIVEPTDPNAFLESIRTLYKTIWSVSDDEDVAAMKAHISLKEDAETIAGNKTDTLSVDLKGCAELFEIEEDDLATFKKILGEEFIVRFGVVGKKHFLCTFGGGAKRYEAACKIAASGGDSLANDKGIAELARVLPKQRSIEGYIAVDNILQIAKSVAKIVGEEEGMPFEVPKIDAPIVFGAAQVGDMQCFKLFVPMKLVTAIKKIIDEQAKAEMEAFDEEDEDEDDDDDDDDD